jgi:hypothetical protein
MSGWQKDGINPRYDGERRMQVDVLEECEENN